MKYILIFSLFFMFTHAKNINECKTDIYFGNGVWNKAFTNDCEEDSAANCSQDVLNDLIQSEIIKYDPKLQAKYGEVKLQYNWGQGRMTDVLETFYQLKEAGQVSDLDFFRVIFVLTRGNISLTLSASAAKTLYEPLNRNWEEGNVNDMLEKYYNESLKYGHRVLLVSHSQGNLFANRVYDNINPTDYRNYFANLQVASPASDVKAQKGDYVTLSTDLTSFDPIINLIPGSMSANASGDSGHAFVSAYLSQADPLAKITQKMKQLLADLDTELSHWELDQELNKGTEDYKITLKHRFDTAITSMNGVEVYPFAPSKKLYIVTDNTGGNGWVKASCGGKEVFDSWATQKDNEFYLLDGTDEYIALECPFDSYYSPTTSSCEQIPTNGWMAIGFYKPFIQRCTYVSVNLQIASAWNGSLIELVSITSTTGAVTQLYTLADWSQAQIVYEPANCTPDLITATIRETNIATGESYLRTATRLWTFPY